MPSRKAKVSVSNDSRLPLCALATVMLASACGKPSARTRRAYVSNEADGTVSVIDTRAERVIATIRVGKRPRGVRVSPDGARLYVALSGSDAIGVVDLDKLRVLRTLEGGHDPEAFDLV